MIAAIIQAIMDSSRLPRKILNYKEDYKLFKIIFKKFYFNNSNLP